MVLYFVLSGINYVVCKMMGIKWWLGWSLGEKEVDEIIDISVMMLMFLVGLLINIIDKNY